MRYPCFVGALASLALVPAASAQSGACCRPDGSCVAAASSSACFNVTVRGQFVPGGACGPGTCYADLIVGELQDTKHWGFEVLNGELVQIYSFGTTSCNLGNVNLRWQWDTPMHPVISQDLFRLSGGRLEHIGTAWLKHGFFALSLNACGGGCPFPTDGSSLGVGCSDPYSAEGENGSQYALGPRSIVNPTTGVFTYAPESWPGSSGEAARRLQAREHDIAPTLNPGALYFIQGQYFTQDDAQAGRGLNNASYRRVSFDGSRTMLLNGPTQRERPVIYAWRDHGLGVNTPDTSVQVSSVDVPGDGRFYVGSRATSLGGGRWRYEYAVQNLNSDRAGGSFSVAIPPGASVTGARFHDINYHSNEPIEGGDWALNVGSGSVTWSAPAPVDPAKGANALRFASLYNFGFEVDAAPAPSGQVTLGLYKPGSPASVTVGAVVPTVPPPCRCDINGGGVDVSDIFAFLALWFANDARADFDGTGGVQVSDIFTFLSCWFGAPGMC